MLRQITSTGLVISESTWRVVPCTAWPARATSMPSGPVIEALLPCAVRVDVHVAGGQNTAFGVDDRVAIGRSSPTVRQQCSKVPSPVPAAMMTPAASETTQYPRRFAARIHLARVANRHRSRLALQCRGHARDYLVPIRHVVLLTAHALPLAEASTR